MKIEFTEKVLLYPKLRLHSLNLLTIFYLLKTVNLCTENLILLKMITLYKSAFLCLQRFDKNYLIFITLLL